MKIHCISEEFIDEMENDDALRLEDESFDNEDEHEGFGPEWIDYLDREGDEKK